MKIDQFNNFTSEKINDVLESRFGSRIDLSTESLDNLQAFQHAVARELEEMEHRIGFNKSMQNPKFVENRMILDLINQAIDEKKGKTMTRMEILIQMTTSKVETLQLKKQWGKMMKIRKMKMPKSKWLEATR